MSTEAPLIYSVDRSWSQHIRLDLNGDPYDKGRKMHRTWPFDDDRYGAARCGRAIILNIEDSWYADDPRLSREELCRRCIPEIPPSQHPDRTVR